MNIVVLGAGAVGSVLGGLLALQKHDVLFICRKQHAETLNEAGGLRLRTATGDYFAELRAATTLSTEDFSEDTCVFITAKSYDTAACVDQLSAVAPKA